MSRQKALPLSTQSLAWQSLTVRIAALLLSLAVLSVPDSRADEPAKARRNATFTEQGSASCLRCHSGEKMRAVNASLHGNADRPGTPEAGRGCETCHGPGSIHVSRAHGGRGFPPLRTFGRGAGAAPREEQLETCLGCHAAEVGGSRPIGFIGSPHDRSTINCSTCHTVHTEVDTIHDRDNQAATCRRCHRRQIEAHPHFEDKGIEFGKLSCGTCHDVHAVTIAGAPCGPRKPSGFGRD
jgi:DmsE family decaheme c-type cytochrome